MPLEGQSFSVVEPTPPKELIVDRSLSATGKSYVVRDFRALQSAVEKAVPGDQILLVPGATYVGRLALPARRQQGGFVTIRTNLAPSALPGPTTRVTPALAASLRFARLVAPGSNGAAIDLAPSSHGWRFAALEITVAPEEAELTTLVRLGDGSARTLDETPGEIVLDRVYVHGSPTLQNVRCILVNSASTAIINSTVSDCHAKGRDSNAIGVITSPGPLLFENNDLQGGGMGIFIGGADPRIQDLVPSDIVIRGNHVWRPLSWKGQWTVKNLLEFKNARRALIENNLFENNWVDGQAGMAINFKSTNQSGRAPWSTTSDVTFRRNVVRNSPSGITIAAHPERFPVVHAARVKVENNLFYNIGAFNGTRAGRMIGLNGPLSDVQLVRNTMVFAEGEGTHGAIMDAQPQLGQAQRLVVRGNVLSLGGVGWRGSGVAPGRATLEKMWGDAYDVSNNVLVGDVPPRAEYPNGNSVVKSLSSLGFRDAAAGDFSLSGSRGADFSALAKALATP
jgi:hypothetical protein